MSLGRFASALVAGAVVGLGAAVASAADLPVKVQPAPPPVPFVLDIHGFFDVSFKNDYITPRGLLVTNSGLTTQVLGGLVFDVYKDPNGFINGVSYTVGIWNDIWSDQHSKTAGSWNEFDWFVGMDVKFARDWRFGVQFVQFQSPPGNFRPENNVEFTLSYDDSKWNPFLPINPYVKLFYAVSGDSTVVLGKRGNTYDVEIGMVPTLDLAKYSLPIVLSAPTWITVGPTDYWNNGATGCGTLSTTPCSLSNTGVFSTGLTGKTAIPTTWIPARLGSWYVKYGFQYFDILNDSLLLAQTKVGTATSFAAAHRDVVVGFGGFGFGF